MDQERVQPFPPPSSESRQSNPGRNDLDFRSDAHDAGIEDPAKLPSIQTAYTSGIRSERNVMMASAVSADPQV